MAPNNEKDLEQVELLESPQGSSSSQAGEGDLNHGHLRVKSEDIQNPLPSPVSASPPKPTKLKLSAATIIPVWIVLSSSVIIYNNYVYNTIGFKYPVFLPTWHLCFAVRRRSSAGTAPR